MIREQAHDYLQGSGFGEGQIKAIESAFVDSALADIKSEVEDMVLGCSPQWHEIPWWNGKKYGLEEVLEIIDKHIKEADN